MTATTPSAASAPATFVPVPPPLVPDTTAKLGLDDMLPAPVEEPERRRGRRMRRPRNRDGMMTLGEHLVEFRKRLILSAAGIAAMTVVGWTFSDQVFAVLQQPFLTASEHYDGLMSITFNGVASAFNVKLELGIFLGIVLSCPWWSYQLWAFINPGLRRRERWTAVAFIAASVPLFLAGATLAWLFLPQAIAILTGFAPAHTSTLLSADVYFTFVLRMTLAFGLAFLLPVVMVALTAVGAVEWRTWLRQWRIAVVVAFVFAAVATPTGDLGTLCGLGLPICAIYFLAIAVCWVCERAQLWRIRLLAFRATASARLGALRARLASLSPKARRDRRTTRKED